MFSQYSWWDFIKFVLALAIPYYAYVLIKYYREDIQEWISNRGQPSLVPVGPEIDEEEEHSPSLFSVKDYSKPAEPDSAQWLPSPSPGSQPSARQPAQTINEPLQDEIVLQGPAVDAQPETGFAIPVVMTADNVSEQSIDEVISAAGRLTADQQGRVVPLDADDKPAAKIADIINQQNGHPLDNFAFNR